MTAHDTCHCAIPSFPANRADAIAKNAWDSISRVSCPLHSPVHYFATLQLLAGAVNFDARFLSHAILAHSGFEETERCHIPLRGCAKLSPCAPSVNFDLDHLLFLNHPDFEVQCRHVTFRISRRLWTLPGFEGKTDSSRNRPKADGPWPA